MKVVKPLDSLGKEIKVGDEVVYAVKTRSAKLQHSKVVALIPYIDKVYIPNPNYDPNQYMGLNNPRQIGEQQQHFKIKVEHEVDVYDWQAPEGQRYSKRMTTKTLDTPGRFAIVNDNQNVHITAQSFSVHGLTSTH